MLYYSPIRKYVDGDNIKIYLRGIEWGIMG
jgi:hypothetical protein